MKSSFIKVFICFHRNKQLSQNLIQKWYINRAYEIESDSRLVDNALTLINLGKSRNVNGLEKILFDLETLDDIVYKVGQEELSLVELEKLNDLEKIHLLMLNSDQKNFIFIIKSMLLPFFRRRKHYLVSINNIQDLITLYNFFPFIKFYFDRAYILIKNYFLNT